MSDDPKYLHVNSMGVRRIVFGSKSLKASSTEQGDQCLRVNPLMLALWNEVLECMYLF